MIGQILFTHWTQYNRAAHRLL